MKAPFIHEDFLLANRSAVRLYHEYAEAEPILDYHCHLPPQDIATNRQFKNLFEIWLEGDHYKWRAMRTNGVPERLCTGNADPYEKFLAWARTVPATLRNPLYHWTHLELKRYFGIESLLDEHSAQSVWNQANEQLAREDLRPHGILRRFQVKVIGTTDDPADALEHHRTIASSQVQTRVLPTFRPDKAMHVHQPEAWNAWIQKLASACGRSIHTLDDLVQALKERHDYFHSLGARLSDHGIEQCPNEFVSEGVAAGIFARARSGHPATALEVAQFSGVILLHVGRWNAARGWTMQLHLGARRNNNSRAFEQLGPDTGFDSISDLPQINALAGFLDRLDRENALPKTILYNLNPADNYAFATMLGNFQDGRTPGKIQLGSGWWFLDQKEGMELQLNALSNLGLLSRFIGMLTDSRSFMSYPRHEYFRRVLCNLLGRDMELGELPDDYNLIGGMVKRICYANAAGYLDLFGT